MKLTPGSSAPDQPPKDLGKTKIKPEPFGWSAELRFGAFTRTEFIIVVAVIALLLLALVPTLKKAQRRGGRINCANNLKQIGLSVRLWSNDNGGRPPSLVPTREGGAKELIEAGSVAGYFQVMSNELGTPKIVACPDDPAHRPAKDFGVLHATNIGFFVVPEADGTVTNLWLAGDRNLATNNVPLKPGWFTMPLNGAVSWTERPQVTYDNLCYADGKVERPSSASLQASAINALLAYRLASTNKSFRIAIP